MLTSLALIFLLGMSLAWIFKKLQLPGLLGMLLGGIILGPYVLDLLDDTILNISADLRQMALIIILTRAGLALNIADLKKVGRPAILMCFVPACFEITGMLILAPSLLGISLLDAAILGSVIAAVSPAVIVPKMLTLMENGYGREKSIPQLIMAGASVDDVFVIVLFASFTNLALTGELSAVSFIKIPISIVTGIFAGAFVGILMGKFFKKVRLRDSVKVIILLCISFLMMTLESSIKDNIPFSGLLAIMSIGIALQKVHLKAAVQISAKYSKLWVGAEVLLFVLVGATVDINYALDAGIAAIVLILSVLLFRMAGVYVCMLKTSLTIKERIFCMIAYLPKATVQAAIGGQPLALGLACGNIVLTVAVLAILITAPLGAFGIEKTYQKLLIDDNNLRSDGNEDQRRSGSVLQNDEESL